MTIDFTHFILPYQPSYNAPSGGGASSFNQILQNRAAAQRQKADLAAAAEQAKTEQAGLMERERFKAGVDSEQKLEEKRRDFAKRFAEKSAIGDTAALTSMAPEAESLGWQLKHVKGGSGRTDPTDPFARLSPAQGPDAYDIVRLEDKAGNRTGLSDMEETRNMNRDRIAKVAEARDQFVRPEDQQAEWQQTMGLTALGAPVTEKTYEDAAGVNNRASGERNAAASRAVALTNAREGREQRAGEFQQTLGLHKDEAERKKAVGDDRERLKWRRDVETVGKTEGVDARRTALEKLATAVRLMKESKPGDPDAGKRQRMAARQLALSVSKGHLTEADAAVVEGNQGLFEDLASKLGSKAYDEFTEEERQRYEDAMAATAEALEAAHTEAYRKMLERAPIGASNPAAMEEFKAYLKAQFGNLPAYREQMGRAPVGGDDIDALMDEIDQNAGATNAGP